MTKQEIIKRVPKAVKSVTTIDYDAVFGILKIVIWPILVLVIVLILRKSIINLVDRIQKFGIGGVSAEARQQKNDQAETLPKQDEKKFDTKNLDKALNQFSDSTINHFANLVDTETSQKEINDFKDKSDVLYKYSQLLYLLNSFNRLYEVIYGSQLSILNKINTTANETKDSVKSFYDDAARYYPDFYSAYNYDEYFGFLISQGLLVQQENETISISAYGRDFLKFLIDTGKPLNKVF